MLFAHCRSILFWFLVLYWLCLIKTKPCDPNSVLVSYKTTVVLPKDQYCSLYTKALSTCSPFLQASSSFLSRVQVSHCQPIGSPQLENCRFFPSLLTLLIQLSHFNDGQLVPVPSVLRVGETLNGKLAEDGELKVNAAKISRILRLI